MGFGKAQQGVQASVIGGAALGWGEALVDLRPAQTDVVGAEEGERIGGRAVAARAADFW